MNARSMPVVPREGFGQHNEYAQLLTAAWPRFVNNQEFEGQICVADTNAANSRDLPLLRRGATGTPRFGVESFAGERPGHSIASQEFA